MQNNVIYGFKMLHRVLVGPPNTVQVTVHHNSESSPVAHKTTDLDFIKDRVNQRIQHMNINVRTTGNLYFSGILQTKDGYGVFRLEYSPLLDVIIGNVIKINVFRNEKDALSHLKVHTRIGDQLIKDINITPQELHNISVKLTPTPFNRMIGHPVSSRVDSKQVSHRARSKLSRSSRKTRK